MDSNNVPVQPPARSGEVTSAAGRWNIASLKRLHRLADTKATWTEGSLGFSISLNGTVIGRLNRHRRGLPWTLSIQGFERWHEPTLIIKHWHYTPVWAVPSLVVAKREVERVLRSAPDLAEDGN